MVGAGGPMREREASMLGVAGELVLLGIVLVLLGGTGLPIVPEAPPRR